MSKPTPMLESLESRSLFSVIPMLPYVHAQPADPLSHTALNTAPLQAKTVAKKPPSILGTWTGRYTIKLFPFGKLKYDLDLDVTKVDKSTSNGTLTVDDDTDYSGRWTGYTQPAGYFSYTLKKNGHKITITGTLNPKSTAAFGTIKIDWGFRSSKGDFTLTKIS